MSWTAVTLAYGTSKDFKRCFDKALSVLQGKRKQEFVTQHYEATRSLDLSLEKSFIFIPEKEFHARKAGFKIETVTDEHKTPVSGVVVADPNQRWPKLVVRSSVGTRLADQLLVARDQVRPNQGSEMSAWWEADLLNQQPHGASSTPTLETVQDKVEAYKAQCQQELRRKEEEKLAAVAAAQALHVKEPDEAQVVEQDSESDDGEKKTLLLPSEQVAHGKGKGGKGAKSNRKKPSAEGLLVVTQKTCCQNIARQASCLPRTSASFLPRMQDLCISLKPFHPNICAHVKALGRSQSSGFCSIWHVFLLSDSENVLSGASVIALCANPPPHLR